MPALLQRRGSPHVHMMAWIEGAPDLSTAAGMAEAPAFIDRYITTCVPQPTADNAAGCPPLAPATSPLTPHPAPCAPHGTCRRV